MLRRLFYPQSQARIEVSVVLSETANNSGTPGFPRLRYRVLLANVGNATAHDLYAIIEDNVHYDDTHGRGLCHSDNWHRRTYDPNKSGFYSSIPIHPGFASEIAYSNDWSPERGMTKQNVIYPWYYTVNVKIVVYSRDSDSQAFEVEFERSEQEKAGSGLEKRCAPLVTIV